MKTLQELLQLTEGEGFQVFHKNAEIEGFTNFAVPRSGPALLGYRDDESQVTLSIDPDGELGPADKILVNLQDEDGNSTVLKAYPDTKDGYANAKRDAEKLLKEGKAERALDKHKGALDDDSLIDAGAKAGEKARQKRAVRSW